MSNSVFYKTDFQATKKYSEKKVSKQSEQILEEQLISLLKKQGYQVFAIEQTSHSVFLQNVAFANGPVAFVFGNEIDGVATNVIDCCDGVIEIPQLGTKHSFNIAVSCGMVLWEYARTRV